MSEPREEQKKKRKWFWVLLVLIALGIVLSVIANPKKGGRSLIDGGNPEIGQINLVSPIFSSEELLACFQLADQSKKLKVLILRVDSPGGFVGSSQELFRRIRQFREHRNLPVIVSVENICASGAYYIAAAADTIIVNPGSQVGSIGVIIDLLNVRELMDKFGIDARTIKTGKYKDAGDPTKRLTEEEDVLERTYFKGLIDQVLAQFVKDVAESRRLPEDKVRKIAHGGVFTGLQAVELGLADSVGNYVDAVRLAAGISGIDPHAAAATIFEPPDRRGLLERVILGESAGGVTAPIHWLGRKYILSFLP